jgi:hypothetical protein
MKAQSFAYILALLSSMASAKDAFFCNSHFGENLQIITEQLGWFGQGETLPDMGLEKGDLNGDGLKDKVLILRLNKATKLDDGVALLNLAAVLAVNRKSGIQAPTNIPLPVKDTIAIGIVQSNISNKKCRKFVIYNTSYFPDNAKHLRAEVFFTSNENYGLLQRNVSMDLRHDAIYLNTPDKGTGLIYWSKDRYVFDLLLETWFEHEENDDMP